MSWSALELKMTGRFKKSIIIIIEKRHHIFSPSTYHIDNLPARKRFFALGSCIKSTTVLNTG
jgi:hypothetical protein